MSPDTSSTPSSPPFSPAPLVVFDLDGTLVDSLDDLTAALNLLPARSDLPALDAASVRPMVGDGVARLVERAMAHDGRAATAADVADYVRIYGAATAVHTRPFDGIPDMLEACARRGWRLAVCTNKPQSAARTLLESLGLRAYFSAIGGGDSFSTRKPAPGHLVATIAAADGTIGRAVMIGDHHNDIAAAAAAGVASVFVTWGYGEAGTGAEADVVATRVADLPQQVATLLGPS